MVMHRDPHPIRLEVGRFIDNFRKMDPDDELFRKLAQAGVDPSLLNRFRKAGSPRKHGAQSSDHKLTVKVAYELLEMGGQVAGGGAIAEIFGRSKSKDIDIFFNDKVQYGKAFFKAFSITPIDVCFYVHKPYELFDLGVSCCCFGPDGHDIDDLCAQAMDTGVSEIIVNRVIEPGKTAERMIKYNRKLGVKYPANQVMFLCAKGNIDKRLIPPLLEVMG